MPPLASKTLDATRLETAELPLDYAPRPKCARRQPIAEELAAYREFGEATCKLVTTFLATDGQTREVPTFVNEFWTAKQRQASSLQEISYRACFKPQLPRFFIERLTQPGEVVYDPFMGRGTTVLEAALLGRVPCGCDINPLSVVLTRARLRPPHLEDVAQRLRQIDFTASDEFPEDLLVFFHPDTLRAIASLKKYLLARRAANALDAVDDWICLLALNRLTGHSPGFFSVYTLPPNQAVSVKSQQKINAKRNQTPPPRDVAKLILKKTRVLLRDCDPPTRQVLASVADQSVLLTEPARNPRPIRLTGGHLAALPRRGGLRHRQLVALLVPGDRRPSREAHRA
jgi:hypothetical protein